MTDTRQKVASRYNWRWWTIDAVSWDSDTRQSLRERVLGKRTERPKLTALGRMIESAQVRDREAAIALGHEFLDRFAHEARGTISVEIRISPPNRRSWTKETRGVDAKRTARAEQSDRPTGTYASCS